MTPLIAIGRFAQLTELTIRALRFYDELGLLKPGHVDANSGYRYYTSDQLERAHLIGRLKRTGMSLEGIKIFLEATTDSRKQLLDHHRTTLQHQAKTTEEAMRVLKALGGQSTDQPPHVSATPMVGMTLWDQHVLCVRADWTEEDVRDRTFVRNDEEGVGVVLPTCDLVADKGFIEEILDAAERQGLEPIAPPYFTSTEQDENGRWHTEVGWPVERPGKPDGRVQPAILHGGDVAKTIYTGRFEDIAFAYRHLWTQLTSNGFTAYGNPREIYVTKLDGRPAEEYVTEVIWPIRGRPAPPPFG